MFKKHFDSYVIDGDSITCELLGFEFTARLVQDTDVRPEEFDCYTPKQIQAWKDDKWHYFGLVLSANYNGADCGEHLASLWGIEGNFPSRRKNPNEYFLEVANDLLPEALQEAQKELEKLRQALAA